MCRSALPYTLRRNFKENQKGIQDNPSFHDIAQSEERKSTFSIVLYNYIAFPFHEFELLLLFLHILNIYTNFPWKIAKSKHKESWQNVSYCCNHVTEIANNNK